MSWVYRSYYKEREIDHGSIFDYNQFILQEFFNCDNETWYRLASHYRSVHGNRSLSYLERKFSEWKNGNYHLTDLMEERILDVMPNFLSKDARNKLIIRDELIRIREEERKYKLGLDEFLRTIKRIVQSNQLKRSSYQKVNSISTFEAFVETIRDELDKIKNIDIEDLSLYYNTDEERKEILNIAKYVLKIKLQSTYKHLKNDIELVSPYFKKNEFDRFKISYKASFGIHDIKFSNTELKEVKFPTFDLRNIISNNKYNEFAEKYLANELKDIFYKRNDNVVDGFLTTTDINIFLSKYLELKKNQDCEVKMNGEFNGEIGILTMSAQYIPPKFLDVEINKKRFAAGLKILIPTLILIWIGESDSWNLLIGLWFITIPVGFGIYSSIKEDFDTITELKNKKKYYA